MTLKFDGWHWKTIGHLFRATSSSVHHFVAIGEFSLELQSGNTQLGSKFLSSVAMKFDLDIWPLTLTVCMEITHVYGNNPWKFYDDTMMETVKRDDRQTDRRTDRRTEPFI